MVEREIRRLPEAAPPVGLDRGVRSLVSLSIGERVCNPRYRARNAKRIQFHQRAINAATVWTKNGKVANREARDRVKAVLRLRRVKERERNARRDYLHKVARYIINTHSAVAMEALNVRMMTRSAKGRVDRPGRNVRAKADLNREI